MDNISKCSKCGEYPKIRAYRNGKGYTALISCSCQYVKSKSDIVRWAINRATHEWNKQNAI